MTQNQAARQRSQDVGGIVRTILTTIIHGLSAIVNWIGRKMDGALGGKTETAQYERFYKSTDRALLVCKWFIIACVVMAIVSHFFGMETLESLVELSIGTFVVVYFAVGILFFIVSLYVFYGAYQRGLVRFFVTMFIGLCISAIILAVATQIFPLFGLILLIVSIWKNHQKRVFLDKYKQYLHFFFKVAIIGLFFQVVTDVSFFLLGHYIEWIEMAANSSQLAQMSEAEAVRLVEKWLSWTVTGFSLTFAVAALGDYIYFRMLRTFFRKEQARGMAFGDCGKMLTIVPMVWLFLMISLLAMMHNGVFSGDQVLADVGVLDEDVTTDITQVGMENVTSTPLQSGMEEVAPSIASDDINVITNAQAMSNPSMNTEAQAFVMPNTTDATPSSTNGISSGAEMYESMQETSMPKMDAAMQASDASIDGDGQAVATDAQESPQMNADTPMGQAHDTVIENPQGMAQGTIHADAQGNVTVNDAMQQPVMTMQCDLVTDAMHIYGADGMSMGDVSNGVIHGVDGLMDGRIVDLPNGTRVIQDAQGMTLATVKPNGIVVDAQQMPIAVLKNV